MISAAVGTLAPLDTAPTRTLSVVPDSLKETVMVSAERLDRLGWVVKVSGGELITRSALAATGIVSLVVDTVICDLSMVPADGLVKPEAVKVTTPVATEALGVTVSVPVENEAVLLVTPGAEKLAVVAPAVKPGKVTKI